jgi:hypothetical protein
MIYLSTRSECYLNGMGSMLGWAWPGLQPAGLTTSRPGCYSRSYRCKKNTSDKCKPSIYCQTHSIIQARLDERKENGKQHYKL